MRESLRIDNVSVDSLVPNEYNPNVVSPENEEKIKESLRRFGQFKPILVRNYKDKLEIVGGEHRWRAAKELGYKKVKVINLGDLSDDDAKKIALIDNGRYGEDDAYRLSEILDGLGDIDDLITYMPYEAQSIENLFSSTEMELDGLDEEEETEEPILKAEKAPKTHVVMRFKVAVENQKLVQKTIEGLIRSQGLDDEDELINAGDALVYLIANGNKEKEEEAD